MKLKHWNYRKYQFIKLKFLAQFFMKQNKLQTTWKLNLWNALAFISISNNYLFTAISTNKVFGRVQRGCKDMSTESKERQSFVVRKVTQILMGMVKMELQRGWVLDDEQQVQVHMRTARFRYSFSQKPEMIAPSQRELQQLMVTREDLLVCKQLRQRGER